MNGPAHFREAEERLKASDWQWQEGYLDGAMHEAAAAQVHATLALAAAMAPTSPLVSDQEMAAWHAAAGHDQPEAADA